jgi:hypothetical protein
LSSPLLVQPNLLASNPWMSAYDAHWSMLNSKSDFQSIFGPPGNPRQVRLDAERYQTSNPDSDDLAKAAFPRVRIAITELTPLTERDSSASECSVTYETQIWTGVQQQRLVMDAAWVIYRAMIGWRQYVKDRVWWQGGKCIYDVDAKKVTVEWPELEGRGAGSDKRDSKGYEQWISTYKTVIQFYFPTISLMLV